MLSTQHSFDEDDTGITRKGNNHALKEKKKAFVKVVSVQNCVLLIFYWEKLYIVVIYLKRWLSEAALRVNAACEWFSQNKEYFQEYTKEQYIQKATYGKIAWSFETTGFPSSATLI